VVVADTGVIRYLVSFAKNIEELLSLLRGSGLEGLIGKRTNSRYEAGERTGARSKSSSIKAEIRDRRLSATDFLLRRDLNRIAQD
jgi:ATP-dependent DNA ligase